jgi:hypothetical protein
MRKYFYIFLYLFSSLVASSFPVLSQDIPEISDVRQINIHQNDSLIKISIYRTDGEDIEPENDRKYYWYALNQVHCNQGSWSGNLLHGTYRVFDSKHRLVEQGEFDMGLKKGTWLKWDKEGNISQETEWEKGKRHGTAKYYKNGALIKEVDYKNNIRHGKTIFIEDGEDVKVVKYRDGEKIVPKEKKDDWFLKRWIKSLKKNKEDKKDEDKKSPAAKDDNKPIKNDI